MSKKEFLENLFDSLNTGMSKEEIYSHIQYYDEYIESEKKNGLTEEEIVRSLGNPRLIAKTILDSTAGRGYSEQEYTSYEEEKVPKGKKKSNILQKIKRTLIIILVCIILFFFLRAGFILFWKFGLPIIVIIFLIRLVYKLFE